MCPKCDEHFFFLRILKVRISIGGTDTLCSSTHLDGDLLWMTGVTFTTSKAYVYSVCLTVFVCLCISVRVTL